MSFAQPNEARYRVTVLGPPGFSSCGTRLDLGSPQQQAVLMALLADAGSFVRTGELIDGLWGERAPATGEAVIRTYISRLRRLFSLQGLGSAITSQSGGYQLEPGLFEVDADDFTRLVERARRESAAGNARAAAKLLEEALDLWTGTALAGVPGEAAEHERSRWERLKLTATQDLLRLRLELGEHAEVAAAVPPLIERNRFEEPLHEIHLLALHRGGRRAEALEVYRTVHDLFDQELGVRPGPRLRALHTKILRADEERVPVLSPGRLFVGREAERAAFRELLAQGRPGVLFFSGSPGIGKTALLRKFAEDAIAAGRPVRQAKPGSRFEGSEPEGAVLLIDAFEEDREAWRRFPEDVTLVVAGRCDPEVAWLIDPVWSGRIGIRRLEALSTAEASTLLAARDVDPAARKSIVDFAEGDPFALSLAAEAVRSGLSQRYVVDTVYTHLAGDPPTEMHRWALYVCAHAVHTTEDLLRAVVPGGRPSELFDWLRGHPCVETTAGGLILGGVLRRVLGPHLRWRDPAGFERVHNRITRLTAGSA